MNGPLRHPMRGRRFEMSDVGRKKFPRHADRRGTLVSESRDGRSWSVLFDGRSSSTSFHKSFVRVLEETERGDQE